MIVAALASALALAGAAVAQSNLTIQVGLSTGANDIFLFTPPTVNASVGDVITFVFSGSPGNHSVTQSSFAAPCTPEAGGFDSGWVFIPASTADGFPTWNLTITNDSVPLWFFCKQLAPSPHCDVGMVGGINVPASGAHTYDNFLSAAKNLTGPSGQGEGQLDGQGASASAPPGPFTGSITGFANPTPGQNSSSANSTAAAGSSSAAATTTAAASAAGRAEFSALTLFFAGVLGVALA